MHGNAPQNRDPDCAPGTDGALPPGAAFVTTIGAAGNGAQQRALATCLGDATRNFPPRELAAATEALARLPGVALLPEEQMAVLLAQNRLCNPICSGCGRKDPVALAAMRPCAGCRLVFYCDNRCAQRDWLGGTGLTESDGGHRAQCAAGHGGGGRDVLYRGPLAVAVVKLP